MRNKFKVWDKTKKKWLNDEDVYIDQDGEVYLIEERTWSYQTFMHKENLTGKVEIVKYTGLKDKNGREIYEGDIVKILYCDTLTFVEFEEGTFTSSFKGTDHSHVLYEVCRGSEVIGNIYENPELLEGVK